MPDPIRQYAVQYARIDTDFGYDALGGIGRLGSHSMETLSPGVRRTYRVPGPAKTVGRWFSKLLDRITPHSMRAQGKFRRGLEDFSAAAGRMLGHLRNLRWAHTLPSGSPQRSAVIHDMLKALAELRRNAVPMTSRGTSYADLLQARLSLNLSILREEQPEIAAELESLGQAGVLDDFMGTLSPESQQDMINDLRMIRNALAPEPGAPPQPETSQRLSSEDVTQEETPAPRYESRHNLNELQRFFHDHCTLRGYAERALQGRQHLMDNLAENAGQALRSALDAIRDAADTPDDTALPEVVSHVCALVDEQMDKAIRYATDAVCTFALPYAKETSSTVGQEGADYHPISEQQIAQELNQAEQAVRQGTGLSFSSPILQGRSGSDTDPFRTGIRKTRMQIRELSAMYGEMISGLAQLKDQNEKLSLCRMLHELAHVQLPEHIPSDCFGEACDALIDTLQSSSPENTEGYEPHLMNLRNWMQDEYMPANLKATFEERYAQLQHLLGAQRREEVYSLDISSSLSKFDQLEREHALHELIEHTGILLRRSGLPQADLLSGEALQLSQTMQKIHAPSGYALGHRELVMQELNAGVARLLGQLAQAEMQVIEPLISSGISENSTRPEASHALKSFRQAIGLLVDEFCTPRDGLPAPEGSAILRMTMRQGSECIRLAGEAARVCTTMKSVGKTEKTVLEQVAVCALSGRSEPSATLRNMLSEKVWNKGHGHQAAKAALEKFLSARDGLTAARKHDDMLKAFSHSMGKDEKGNDRIVIHDMRVGLDGILYLLINTDRKTSRSQGVRWISCPPPDKLPALGKSTGIHRLDDILSLEENRTGFYASFYHVAERHLSGTELYSFAPDNSSEH